MYLLYYRNNHNNPNFKFVDLALGIRCFLSKLNKSERISGISHIFLSFTSRQLQFKITYFSWLISKLPENNNTEWVQIAGRSITTHMWRVLNLSYLNKKNIKVYAVTVNLPSSKRAWIRFGVPIPIWTWALLRYFACRVSYKIKYYSTMLILINVQLLSVTNIKLAVLHSMSLNATNLYMFGKKFDHLTTRSLEKFNKPEM